MKKFYIYNADTEELNAVYFGFRGGKFSDILGAEYIMQTSGDPITDNDQDIDLEELMDMADTEPTDLTAADIDYITSLCKAWAIF